VHTKFHKIYELIKKLWVGYKHVEMLTTSAYPCI